MEYVLVICGLIIAGLLGYISGHISYTGGNLKLIINKLNKMEQTLDELLVAVTDESALDDSIITLLNGIAQQLKDALSGTTLPPAVQAKVDAVFAQVEANKAKVSQAITDNTPAEG